MTEQNYIENIGGLPEGENHLLSYIAGFVLSLALTIVAYLFTTHHLSTGMSAVAALLVLATLQFFVQMYFFLHLGARATSEYKRGIFAYAILIVLIIVVGSIWIMHSLNARMMADTSAMMEYMHKQPGL